MESQTHYQVLEVAEDATTVEVQRAYYTLVRRFRPNRDPEQYQRLNEARDTLTDDRRRGAYDQERRSGSRVRVLVDQAALCMDRDPQKALSLLKNAVAIAPDLPRTRALLAHVLMRMSELPLAEKQFRWLLRQAPHDEQIHCRLAECLWRQKRDTDAEEALRQALRLNPAYHDALILQARLYRETGRNDALIAALEKAIANDGQENWADFSALLQLVMVWASQENEEMLAATLERMRAVIPPDKEMQAADSFLRIGQGLCDQERYQEAGILLELLAGPPLSAEGQEAVRLLAYKAALAAVAELMVRDTLIGPGLTLLFKTLYLDRSSEAIREGRMEEALERLRREQESDPRGLIRQVDYLRREHPDIAGAQDAFLTQLKTRALDRVAALERTAYAMPDRIPPPLHAGAPPVVTKPKGLTGLLGRLRGGKSGD